MAMNNSRSGARCPKSLQALCIKRIERLEERIFGDNESLIERIAVLEAQEKELCRKFDELKADQEKKVILDTNNLLSKLNEKYDTQISELRRNNRFALVGTIIALAGLMAGVLAKAAGWF